MATDLDFLLDLCAAPAPTGFEAPAQEIVRRRLAGIATTEGDPLGNVWADVVPDGSPHVVVAAHNDQIGLIVTYVDEQGYVSFDKIGGVDAQLLPGRNLVVHGPGGPVNGVVGRRPSHKMTSEERAKAPDLHEQWLDLGAASRDEALELVQIGDPITFPANFLPLANGRYASPAFDNRAGVYVCARALEHYASAPAAAKLTALATVHEETTFMGAKAMAMRWQPDVMIVVDVDFASDDPGMDAKQLGGEVQLDAGPVLHRGAASNQASWPWRATWLRQRASRCRSKRCRAAPPPTPRSSWRRVRRRRSPSASRCATCTRRSRSCSRTTRKRARCSPPPSPGAWRRAGIASISCHASEPRPARSQPLPKRG